MKKAIFIFAIVAQAFNANALDNGQPLVEVARKMKAIEGMQPQINDMERRLGIMQSVEPVLENAIKTLQKVVDVRGMGKKRRLLWDDISDLSPEQEYVLGSMQEHVNEIHQNLKILQSIPDVPIFESSRRLHDGVAEKGYDEDDLAKAIAAAAKKAKEDAMKCLAGQDDGQPLVEVARKMKAIEGMQPQINDLERRLGIMQSVEPVLENAIKTLQKVVDVRGMGRRLSENDPAMTTVKKWSLESSKHWPKEFSWDGEKFPEHRTPLQRVSDMHVMVDYITEKLKNPTINGSPSMLRSKPKLLGQPLVEVARKMKAIEGMQPQINDLERRLGIMQSVEPVLENAIKTLQKVVDVRGMG